MRRELEDAIEEVIYARLRPYDVLDADAHRTAAAILKHLRDLGYFIGKVEAQAPTTGITLPVLHIKNLE